MLRKSSLTLPGPGNGRRALLGAGAALGLSALGASAAAGPKPGNHNKKKGEEDVGPLEDLMREHGVLRRALLVYGELGRRLAGTGDLDAAIIQKNAQLIRNFVENYHERQEEEMVFPRFERAHRLADLVAVLREQHQAGRNVTDRLQAQATAAALKDPARRLQLRDLMQSFTRMYEAHAAREDTVLFPALHDLLSPNEFDALGEDFERRERATFGEGGFEHAVAEVDALEKELGIEALAQFTVKT